jgi:predicted nuclease of predicted toxin-antitoxin system
MKLLLDECVTRYLKQDFIGHEVKTVREAGFTGLKNGQLLKAAETEFDVLVTVDQSIRHQQNVRAFDLGVLILAAKTNKYDDLKPLVPRALEALKSLQPGTFVLVEASI